MKVTTIYVNANSGYIDWFSHIVKDDTKNAKTSENVKFWHFYLVSFDFLKHVSKS